ncbi:hypothetical protein N7481_008544 [Penicillium waksmanii]|uniref:uncharacterized protein n=1 Tax=Penicillium waksmanii TaxID=69791 RepID=UPI0025481E2A|nr:uncharacterized protein N7481_008544 [Penicillium waksmanii]KAJ5974837.1 hypothetical protein N7481_008544 [Penicillium waksmanii]
MPASTLSNRKSDDSARPVKRRRLRDEIDTILSLCDYLIEATTDSNIRLRSELVETREKLAKAQGKYDDLESSHLQCPYWIQRNESLALTSDDRCEKLEKENEKLQKMCDGLKAENRRLRRQGSVEDVDSEGEEMHDV